MVIVREMQARECYFCGHPIRKINDRGPWASQRDDSLACALPIGNRDAHVPKSIKRGQ